MDKEYPQTIEEVVEHLKKRVGKSDLISIQKMAKEDLIFLHHGLGTNIRNNYGLWGENKELLESCKKQHPDDASMVIIEELWENLQNNNF